MATSYSTTNTLGGNTYATIRSTGRNYAATDGRNGMGTRLTGNGIAIDDGIYVDGSWELRVFVEDLGIDKKLRVRGDLHLGGVMHLLVESIDMKMDWSDHALWWPEKQRWLLKTRSTLDQCAVQADVQLEFRRMNNFVIVQLPDLQERTVRINFAKRVFSVVVQLCKELGIRHPEELSLGRVIDKDDLRRNSSIRRRNTSLSLRNQKPLSAQSTNFNPFVPKSAGWNSSLSSPTLFPPNSAASPLSNGYGFNSVSMNMLSPASVNSLAFEGADESLLANTPPVSAFEAFEERGLCRPKSLLQKARINQCWLDSSRTLMEQGVEPSEDRLLLRFKYFCFYDLNPKYDSIRINQLFEQAKWSILSEEIDCTEEEAMLLAALQFQVNLQATEPQNNANADTSECLAEDEIDAALAELELNMSVVDCLDKVNNGVSSGSGAAALSQTAVYQVPKLTGYLKFFKPKRYSLKHYKHYFFLLEETTLSMFKDESSARSSPIEVFSLRNTEVSPDVNLTTQKFGIKLFVHSSNGVMQEIWLRCKNREQYSEWMAACNLVSRGKTMASRAQYDFEVRATLNYLELQAPKAQPLFSVESMPKIRPDDFVASRFLKKLRTRQIHVKILERHVNVRDKNLLEAKLEYIKTWQRLPAHGISYFVGRFNRLKREELLGITYNRVMRLDALHGEVLNTWRYREMRSWTVNWETKEVLMEYDNEVVAFHPLSAPCKTIHEFIGGYVFLNLRTPEKSQDLNEEFFHKLTGGNIDESSVSALS